MAKYINKDCVVAEIEKLIDKGKYHEEYDCAYRDGNNSALYALKEKIDTLEVKEVGDEPECKIIPRPIECDSTCKECPWLATNNKAQKGE